jgi:molecular chaperone DnaK
MKKSIGIDLGTTNSVAAIKDTSVKIIRNSQNEELTRSCVGLIKGEIVVGSAAYRLLERDNINTILSIKRLMGGAIKDTMVQDMINSGHYKFGITSLKGGTDDAVAVILGGKQFTPEQISAEILKKIKSDVEEKLGDEVTHAVITVPAYFTEKQRNATRVSAQLAGIKVQKLIAEPTAAAIAYGADNLSPGDAKTVLIYDFGGGTFDLSILNIVDKDFHEAGTGGDRWLGGDNIDRKLEEYILNKVKEITHINDLKTYIENLPEKKKVLFEGQMRFQTERAKIELSSTKTASILIDNILEDENGEIIDIDVTITRQEFEDLIMPFIERSIDLIEVLFKEVGYDISMIDNILLVGGTSCIPIVKKMLSDKYGVNKVKVSEKPMLAIAEGAAILSHRLGDDYELAIDTQPAIGEISYSTSHNYFIELIDSNDDNIVEKQTPLPCNVVRTYKTSVNNQKIVKVDIYAVVEEGKKERQTLGFFTIEEDLPKNSEIVFDITLSIDHVFEIKVYPKNNRPKIKNIVLGRGDRDSKALELLSNYLEKILGNTYTDRQREFFFNAAQKEIENINSLGSNCRDFEKWGEIGTNTFAAFEQAERVTDEIDEDLLAVIIAQVLTHEYADLIGNDDAIEMRRLIGQIKNENDTIVKIQASSRLKAINENYSVLIMLYTLKMASEKAAQSNPSDAHQLLQMHDQIIRLFRQSRREEAFALLDEAITLRDRYDEGGFNVGIHLTR